MSGSFRKCAVTGLQVHRDAERLIKANAVAAVVFLALGGIMALLVALTRWQVVHLLPADWFYRLVTAHGNTMLVFWIVFFEVAGLYFGGAVLLNTRLAVPRLAWWAFALMLAGAVVAEYAMLSGQATVMITAYPPLRAEPLFYGSLLVFAVGALLAVGVYFATVLTARREGVLRGSMPLVAYGFLAAAVLAVFSLLSGALALAPLLVWSLGLIPNVDPAAYRLLFWGFGHGTQQVNLAAMVACWYALAALTTGARPLHEGLSRMAFLLYILFIQLGSIHHLLVDPGLGATNRIMNTSYFMYLAVLGSLIHAFSIPSAVEVAQRARGHNRGLFGWLRRAPWREPGFSSLALSFVIFGFLAGVTGVIMGVPQLDMLVHNTLYVPGHFHLTVVSGTTVAFMGIAYYLVPLITRRQLVGGCMARWQPYVFSLGLLLMTGGMLLAGQMGVPRRVWDITYDLAPLATGVFQTPAVQLALGLFGIGALVAVAGGAMFVAVMVGTLWLGKATDRPAVFVQAPALPAAMGGSQHADPTAEEPSLRAPGTLALVFIFLAWFVLAYVAAWHNLAGSWGVQ